MFRKIVHPWMCHWTSKTSLSEISLWATSIASTSSVSSYSFSTPTPSKPPGEIGTSACCTRTVWKYRRNTGIHTEYGLDVYHVCLLNRMFRTSSNISRLWEIWKMIPEYLGVICQMSSFISLILTEKKLHGGASRCIRPRSLYSPRSPAQG